MIKFKTINCENSEISMKFESSSKCKRYKIVNLNGGNTIMNKKDIKELTLYKEDYPECGWLEICEALNILKEVKEVTIECKVKSAN